MKLIITILYAFSIGYSQEWFMKEYMINKITSCTVFKEEYIKCNKNEYKIYCKASLDSTAIVEIYNAIYEIKDTIKIGNGKENQEGYLLINGNTAIHFINSFLYPCDYSKKIINTYKFLGSNIVRSSLKIKEYCKILNTIQWKEISFFEYYNMLIYNSFTKPDFGYIDSNFTEKGKYKLGKIVGLEENCEKQYNLKRIQK